MPRNGRPEVTLVVARARAAALAGAVAVVLVGCGFDASYGGGHYRCGDGKCPSGLACVAEVCVAPGDAGDGADAAGDARLAALTCADPGQLPAAGGTRSGTTAGGANRVAATCGGAVMNGFDAVYRVDVLAGDHVMVAVSSGSYPVAGYVISPCAPAPAMPSCEGGAAATMGNPISVTAAAAGPQFVIVDGVNAGLAGDYALTVSVMP